MNVWSSGLNPWPSAYTHLDGKTLKIWACDVLPQSASKGESGEILEVTKDAIHVQTGDGILVLRRDSACRKSKNGCRCIFKRIQSSSGNGTFGRIGGNYAVFLLL